MYDLIIVGGGISGLYLYYKLIHSGKKIILLEKNKNLGGRIYQHEENVSGHRYSFPAGAARFNEKHKLVIQLLRDFDLIDFRKHKSLSSKLSFIDTKGNFSEKFKNKTGFDYIRAVLKHAKQHDIKLLKQTSFRKFAATCLPKDEVDFLLVASGYSGQLKKMNMYDAYFLFKDGINDTDNYYVGRFHILIEKLEQFLKKNNGMIRKNSDVKTLQYDCNKQVYVLGCNGKKMHTRTIALCIPQQALLSFPFLKPIKHILSTSIDTKPLCRVYACFKKEDIWFHNLQKKIITNNPLRFIIPMDNENGLIMISYSDDVYCNYWNKIKHSEKQLKNAIVKHVNQTFRIHIQPPEKVWVFYWEHGVGYWKPNIDSEQMSNFIRHPFSNVYICGENYSLQQSWVEGALESCEKTLETLQL